MSIVSGTLGAVMSADAQDDATQANKDISAAGLAQQRQLYDEEVARNKPFYSGGIEANANLQSMLYGKPVTYNDPNAQKLTQADIDGLNASINSKQPYTTSFGSIVAQPAPGAPGGQYDRTKTWYRDSQGNIVDHVPTQTADYKVSESPSAKYQLTQGTKSLNRQLAARGLLGSGNASQRLAELSAGVAAEDYDRQYGRLLDQVKIGTGASASAGGASQTLSNQIGQNSLAQQQANTQSGQARAALYSGMGNASASAAGAAINAYRSKLFSSPEVADVSADAYMPAAQYYSNNAAAEAAL